MPTSAVVGHGDTTAATSTASAPPDRFAIVGGSFQIERVGPVVRIWCGACDKHEVLPDDQEMTVAVAKAAHRCGERAAPWDRRDLSPR